MNFIRTLKFLIRNAWNSPTLMTWGNMVSSSLKLLVLTPLILVRYNINEIAFWYLLLTINSFAIVIDFGFYPTFSRVISYAFHGLESLEDIDGNHKSSNNKPNWTLMAKIYGTINTTYLLLSFIILIIVFSITFFSVRDVIVRTDDVQQLWIAYCLYNVSVFVSFFSKKFDSVIIGTKNVVLINRWDIINNVLNALSSILIVYFKLDMCFLALNQLFFAIVLITRDYFLERSICNGQFKKFQFFAFDKEVFKWCWGPTWRSGILVLCSTGINQASGLIYSHVSDSKMLASYLLTLKLVTTIQQFSQAPFYSKLPRFSGLRVNKQIEELVSLTAQSMKKSLFVFVIGMAILFFFGNWSLEAIHSRASLVNYLFIITMAFVWFFDRNSSMHTQIYITTNKVPFYKTAIITGFVNISLIILFLPKIGVWVFPLAFGLSNLLINTWWNMKISLRSLNQRFWEYSRRSMFYPLLLLIILSIFRILIK